MSIIRSEFERIIAAVNRAHAKVLAKGGTTSQPYTVEKLEAAIDTIQVGEEVTEETDEYTVLLADLAAFVDSLPD